MCSLIEYTQSFLHKLTITNNTLFSKGQSMCNHKRIIIIPTTENSWGIADTFHIKCQDCHKLLYEDIISYEISNYIKILQPSNINELLDFF